MAKSSLNGRRANEKSSSNGQAQDANGSLNTSNSSSSNSDGVIRVGSSFQAQVQAWDPTERHEPTEEEWRIIDDNGVCCLWYPPKDRADRMPNENMISDQEIQKFELEAVETYGFKPEQALGLLMYHEYDLNLAKEDLAIYRPSETGIDSWDADDRIIFETAYRLHAKSFLKIQETLPNKKIADLVAYYYRWKKTQNGGVSLSNIQTKSSKSKDDQKSKTKEKKHLERHTFSGPRSVIWAENDQNDYAPLLTPTMIGQILEEKLHSTDWQVMEQAVEKRKKDELAILSSTSRIQKAKQAVQLEQENKPVDLSKLRKLSTRPNIEICSEFKAEEVYLLGLAITDHGSNWERIVKVCLPNKTPECVAAFYEVDKTSNKFKLAGNMAKYEETQKRKLAQKRKLEINSEKDKKTSRM